MDKRFWAIIGVILLAFVGFVVIHNNNKSTTSSSSTPASQHFTGNLTSKVLLQEYGDYECPACFDFYGTVKQVVQKYNASVKFQFSNLPLPSLHPNAIAGARAAEAAALQGKFWEMHDALYDNQDPRGASGWVASKNPLDDYFVNYAKQIGLDVNKFKTDYASEAVNNTVNADIAAFKKTSHGDTQGTPTFYLNGKYISNNDLLDPTTNQPGLAQFSKYIDEALKNNK